MIRALALFLAVLPGVAFAASEYNARPNSGAAQVCSVGGGVQSVVCSGLGNTATDIWAVVSGGVANTASGSESVIAGGANNFALGAASVVSGGSANIVYGSNATITGGANNVAKGDNSVVSGNQGVASGQFSAIAGGLLNTAGGDYSTVAGGRGNSAMGAYSYAGGQFSSATADGSWVWADASTTTILQDHGPNTYTIRAASGTFISSGSLIVQNAVIATTFNAIGSAYQINSFTFLATGANLRVSSITATGQVTYFGPQTVIGSSVTIIDTNAADTYALIVTTTDASGTIRPFAVNRLTGVIEEEFGIITRGRGYGPSSGAATVGGSRGTGANDLQTSRNNVIQVAAGRFSSILGGRQNRISGDHAVIGGGFQNVASTGAFVGGGQQNTAGASTSTVVGGSVNTIGNASVFGFIGGGKSNTLNASAPYGFIGGGISNSISPNASSATIVGGDSNSVAGIRGFVGGGGSNSAAGLESVIAGGSNNTAGGTGGAVLGGTDNHADGNYSFAGGADATSSLDGSWTWADVGAPLTNSTANSYLARFSGGYNVNTSTLTVLDASGTLPLFYVDHSSAAFPAQVSAASYVGKASALSGVGHYGNFSGFSSTLGAGTTFQAYAPSQAIVISSISVTVVIPGIGGTGDVYSCGTGAGAVSVTVPAATAAGVTTSGGGSVSVAVGSRVSLWLDSSAITTPVVNVVCEYSFP